MGRQTQYDLPLCFPSKYVGVGAFPTKLRCHTKTLLCHHLETRENMLEISETKNISVSSQQPKLRLRIASDEPEEIIKNEIQITN